MAFLEKGADPWLVHFRCVEMGDIVGHVHKKLVIEKWIELRSLPNIIFYGEPTGKTSMARIIAERYSSGNTLFYSSYEDRTPPGIKKYIEPFISCKTAADRVIIIDDFENVAINSQNYILTLINKYPKCKWIITCRFLEQVSENIQRHFQLFHFDKLGKEDITKRLVWIAREIGLVIKKDTLDALIRFSNNDLISCINNFQNMFFYDRNFNSLTLSEIIDMPIQQVLSGMMFHIRSKNYIALWNMILNMEISGIHVQDWVKYIDTWLDTIALNDEEKLDMYTRIVKLNIDILEGKDSSEHFFIRLTECTDDGITAIDDGEAEGADVIPGAIPEEITAEL
jgi:DNA polymerase III delta prime subunit